MIKTGEPLRSLEIFRSVTNIDEADIAKVQQALNSPSEIDAVAVRPPGNIRRLFKPAHSLASRLIGYSELLRLHEYIGWNSSVDEDHIEELEDYLRNALPDFSEQPVSVPTRPTKEFPVYGRVGSVLLSVAVSPELINERIFAKQALHNFYRVEREPAHVWEDDERATGVWLAASRNKTTTDFLRKIGWVLDSDSTLLPANTSFDHVETRRYTKNVSPVEGTLLVR